MRINGIDFTSAPSKAKPLTCASCRLHGNHLTLERLHRWTDFSQLEAWLRRPGPWVAGLDFPFGLPKALTDALEWGDTWTAHVQRAAALDRTEWRARLAAFRATRPTGSKEPPRVTDRRVGAQSAMKAVNPPIALMYQCGADYLRASNVNIIPCRPTRDDRSAIETYPALLARTLIGRAPYKHDGAARKDPARRHQRRKLIDALIAQAPQHWQLQISLSAHHRRHLIADGSGDLVDALLCAVQAAWAWQQPALLQPPSTRLQAEGWIPWQDARP